MVSDWEQKCSSLAAELTAGRDVAKQLQLILSFIPPPPSGHHHSSSSEQATREVLVQKILDSYENALSMLNNHHQRSATSTSSALLTMPAHHHHPLLGGGGGDDDGIGMVVAMMKSSPPGTRSGSPGSEDSDSSPHDHFKDTTSNISPSRKRKSIPRWTHQVRVSPGMGLEGPLDDGFSWRKYGQKDILGAKYPRGYYRCTLRNVQGCLATKQVQRSDDDSTLFEITYRGRHTCNQSPAGPNNASPPPPPPPPPPPLEPDHHHHHDQLLLNFRRGLTDGSDFDYNSPPNTSTAATSFAGSLFFPPATVNMTSFAPPTSSTCSTIYHHSFGGSGGITNDSNVISYGREQGTSDVAAPPATVGLGDFPFGNMDHLFDDATAFTFDNSGFFS